MTRSLRPYQTDMIDATRADWSAGARNVLAVSATGSGKTVVASAVIADEPGASVFIAHRTELVSQASLAIAREGVRHRVIGPDSLRRNCSQIHMAELGRSFYDPGARAAVAGVDTLVRMSATDPWLHQVKLWICDEAAHLLAENKWGRACAMFPNARGLGFTATPVRSDGKGLGRHADGVFDTMVLGPPMSELLERGYLTKYKLFCPPNDIDLTNVPTSASGDFSPAPLRNAVHKSKVVGDIVKHYLRLAKGKLGMTFCVDIDAAEEVATAFRAAGVPAELITGKTPDILRASLMRQFRSRQIMQLVSVDILGEGVDVPAVEVISLARPTASLGLHMQQVGRALRLMEGKEFAIVFDHAGNSLRHGLVDAHREWSLDRRERRSRTAPTDVIPVRTCLNERCMGVYERVLTACPYCGHVQPIGDRSAPQQVDGDLYELDPAVLAAMRGEVARVDGDPRYPAGAAPEVIGAIHKRHIERQAAQSLLRGVIAVWAGWQLSLGRSDSESYRRFYHAFGIDVISAQSLAPRDANALLDRISAELNRNNLRGQEVDGRLD